MNCRHSSTPSRRTRGWQTGLLGAVLALFGISANAQTIWDTGSLPFSNTSGVGTDAITAQSILTRAATGPIYNSACQTPPGGGGGCAYTGPCNTEWAIGTIANWNTYTYQPLYTANGCAPPTMNGQTWVCHLIAENIYFQLTWGPYSGSTYSYTRTTAPTGPVNVAGATVGNGVYATLGAAFTAINGGVQTGTDNILITIGGNTTEGGPAVLNTGAWATLKIEPSVPATISGATATGRGLIELNGADNVTMEGSVTATTTRDLTITNTAVNTTTFTSVVRVATTTGNLTADNIIIKNCNLNGSATGRNAAAATSTTGSEATTFGVLVGPNGAIPPAAPTAITSTTTGMAASTTTNNFVVNNCTLNACARAVNFLGSATTSSTAMSVTNNLIGDQATDNTAVVPPYASPATTVYARAVYVQGATSVTVTGNTIKNILAYVIALQSAVDLAANIGTTVNVNNNAITTVCTNVANSNATRGIMLGAAAGPVTNINGNTITNICSVPSAQTGQPIGIDVTYSGSAGSISNNIVRQIRQRSTGGRGSWGIKLTGGNGWNVVNNFVSDVLNIGSASFGNSFNADGILALAGNNHRILHNTVYLFGTSGGSGSNSVNCLSLGANTQTGIDVRNNVFVNTVTGAAGTDAHTCVFLPFAVSAGMNLTLNNNAYYSSTASVQHGIAYAGSASFSAANLYSAANFNPGLTTPATNFRAFSSALGVATNDNASFAATSAAPLVSTTDLHVSGTPAALNNTGASLGITTDFDSQYRSTPPDMGADEFTTNPCAGATGTVNYVQDCANSQFFLDVTITALNGSSTLDVGSDYSGNPGADLAVGLGTYQIGPFPSNTNVQVLLTSNTSALCNTSLGTYTFDCSTNGQNALSFDGVNDRVNIPNSASTNITGTQITLEAWIYPTAFRTSSFEGSIINKEQATGSAGYMLRCGANGVLSFAVGTGAFPEVLSPAGTLVLNTWQHVAGVYDGATMRIYKDGVQVGSAAQAAAIASSASTPLQIGNWGQNDSRGFIGKIDEVRVWSVARTVPQISTNKNFLLCGNEAGLNAYYRLDQGTAGGNNIAVTTATDMTVNANNGTLLNMALSGPTSNWVLGKTGLGSCVTCLQPSATAATQQDCANSQFFINVTVSSLNGGPSVNVVSNYSGNPGADFGVGVGTHQIGPFPSNTNVQVTVEHTGDAACNLVLGTYTYDCSTFGQNALNFDGGNDGVNCGNAASLNITGTQVTLEAWIYPTLFKANTFDGNIINKEGGNAGYQLRCGGAGILESALGYGTGYVTVTSPANTLTLNTWQHVAVTYDGANARLYKNGVQVASVAGTQSIVTSPNAMRIGDYAVAPGTRNFAGKIDEARVWSVARSAGDIASFVNQQLCGNEAGLAAYYHFDQGIADENNAAVTTLIDASPNGNTGTLGGFALIGTTSNWVLGKTGMGVCVACAGTPTAGTITGNGSVCNAASNVLSLTGATYGLGISYQWKYGPVGGPYTNLLGTNLSQGTSGIPVGTYEVVVDVTCNAGPTTVTTVPFPLTIKPVPTASASAGQGCTGQALNLTGGTNIGTVFTWSGPNSFTSTAQNPSIPAITAAAAGTYTFTATLNGCSSTPSTVSVTVNVSPTFYSATATPSTICSGDNSQLNVVAATTGYVMGSGGATFQDISGTGTSVGAVTDDSEHNITFPAFTFNGVSYTSGRVGLNGAFVFGVSAGDVSTANAALPNTVSGGTAFLAPFWDDLDVAGPSAIYTQQMGSTFIVQWNAVSHNTPDPPLAADVVTFQIQLNQSNGRIYYVYQDVLFGGTHVANDAGASATVGIQWANAAGSFIQSSFNTASLTNGQVISFTPNTPPVTWSPATFLNNPSISNPLASGVTATTTYTVTATTNGCSVQGTTTVNMVPIDDGDPCTVDGCSGGVATHTYTDTDNDGTCDGLDGCPLDPLKLAPGICGCGVSDVDTDSDGTADCNDGCPLDPNKIAAGICGCGVADTDTDNDGTADCNDGCPTDPNKIAPGLCGCFNPEGTCNDCEGVPSGPAQPGTPCEDNNACTINDVWSPSCVCAGTFQDTDGDGACDADDICPGANDFLDTDGDGLVDCLDNCPLIGGQIGTACNDGNPNTTGDVVDANCVCAGTVPPCPNNLTVLNLTTDNDAAQTTWDVIPVGGGIPLCSGAGMANNSTFGYNCCLPNGCYELRVFDSAGDGMANGSIGGYALVQSAGNKRIIDNSGDGIFTTISQVANNLGFCLPLGNDGVIAINCDKTDWLPNDVIQATLNSAVTGQFGVSNANSGYQFWFFNPDGGYSRRITQTHAAPGAVSGPAPNIRAAYLRLSAVVTQPIPFYTNLNVRVRTEVAGVFSEFGPACRFRLDPPCTTTQLTPVADPVVSCGATGLTLGSTIYATSIPGATTYQFEFSKPGYTRRIAQSVRSTALSFVTSPLQNNNCYNVRVRISFDGAQTYCPFGPYCTITIGTALCGGSMTLEGDGVEGTTSTANVHVWPNPNDGHLVNISLTEFDETATSVLVDVTDVYGKLISTRNIAVEGGYLNTVLPFDHDLAPGFYLVNLTAGDKRYTERLVIQR